MRLTAKELAAIAQRGNKSAQAALSTLGATARGNTGQQHSLCNALAAQLKTAGAPDFMWDGSPEGEHQFHPRRRWRLDFFFPEYKVAIEVEGGVSTHRRSKAVSQDGAEYYRQSRHLTPAGFEEDAIKYFEAAKQGIFVLRVTSKMVSDHRAVSMAIQLLESRGWTPPATQMAHELRAVVNN